MRTIQTAMTAAVAGIFLAAAPAARSQTNQDLNARINELEQKLQRLEDQLAKGGETPVSGAAPPAAVVSAGASGFFIRSADTNFVMKVGGYIQADGRFFPGGSAADANNTFLLRRVRPIFEGTLFQKYDFRLMLDFGSGITTSSANDGYLQDAYLNARWLPELQLQIGKFKVPVGLERMQSTANLLFVELGYPSQLVPNYDTGIQLHGALFDNVATYSAGIYNGVQDGGSGDSEISDGSKEFGGNLFLTPFRHGSWASLQGLGFGVGASVGDQDGTPRGFVSGGQQKILSYRSGAGTNAATANVVTDGLHWRLVPQAYYYVGSLGLFTEYAISDQQFRRDAGSSSFKRLENSAWQIAGSYFLTGEQNSWGAVTPKKPFQWSGGGWGAVEVTARYDQLTVDPATFPLFANPASAAAKASSWTLGLNWHLNRNVKFNLNYQQTEFSGGASPLLSRGEKAIMTRAQVAF